MSEFEFKGTPGPWCWINVHRQEFRHGALYADRCLVLDSANLIYSGSENPDEFTANAHLIAAAPDMAKALHKISEVLATPHSSSTEDRLYAALDALDEVRAIACNALSHAIGKE